MRSAGTPKAGRGSPASAGTGDGARHARRVCLAGRNGAHLHGLTRTDHRLDLGLHLEQLHRTEIIASTSLMRSGVKGSTVSSDSLLAGFCTTRGAPSGVRAEEIVASVSCRASGAGSQT